MPDDLELESEQPSEPAKPGSKRFEDWAQEKGHSKGPGLVLSKCAKVYKRWDDSTLVTEADYDTAVKEAQELT